MKNKDKAPEKPKYQLEIQARRHFGYRVINLKGDAELGDWHIADFAWLPHAEFFVKAWELKHG